MRIRWAVIPCLVVLLCGCHDAAKDWPLSTSGSATSSTISSGCAAGDQSCDDLRKVANYCERVREKYAAGANASNAAQLITAVSGALAGAVVAPLAKGSAKDAASGFSGSANAIQKQIGDAFNTATALSESSAVYFAFASSYQDYINAGSDTEKKKQVLVLMAMKCAAAPNIATSDAMRALLSGGIPTNWPSSQPNNSPAPASSVVTPPKPTQGIDLLVQPLAKPGQ